MTGLLMTLLAATPTVEGTWVSVDAKANQTAVDRAVDATGEPFGVLLKPLVVATLREKNPVFPSITIRRNKDAVTCVSGPLQATTIGGVGTLIGLDGSANELTHQLTDTSLTQVTWNELGRRKTVFSVSPDGDRLDVAIEVSSPRLPVPVRYLLQYRRATTRG